MRVASLATVRRAQRQGFVLRGAATPPIAMTLPLIGALLAITFFLLPLFEGSGEVCGGFRQKISLPFATQVADLESAPVVLVSEDGVFLDGRREDIVRLSDDLLALRGTIALFHPDASVARRFLLEAARSIPYGRIADVVRAAKRAGYDAPDYVVESEK